MTDGPNQPQRHEGLKGSRIFALRVPAFLFVLFAPLWFPIRPASAQDANRVFPLGGQRGTTVAVTFAGMDKEPSATLVVDGPGVKPVGPFVKGVGQVEIAADAASGVRQVRLVGPKSATEPRPFAVGMLPEVAEKEPNDSSSQAQALKLPVVLNGAIPRGQDSDLYKIPLKKGDFLVIAGESRLLAAATYLAFHIRDPSGRALPNTLDVRRMDPACTFTAPEDGEYVLQLHDITGNMGSVDAASAYRLTLTTGPWLDYAIPSAVQRGAPSPLRVFGWNLNGKSGPGTAMVEVSAPEMGDSVFATVQGAPNPLRIAVTAEPAIPEKEPNEAEPQVITLPAAIDGAFEARGDVDGFRFTARAKDRLLIDVAAREWGSFADPVLTLKDAAGKSLQNIDDADRARDPRLVWTVPADGTYTLLLRDLASSRGGPASFYRLRIAPAEPELRLTAEAPNVTLKPGGKAELTLRLFQSYQPGEVTVSVEGLPQGVTAAPLKVAGVGGRENSSSIKLALTAAADAPTGFATVRARALTAGEKPVSAVAYWQRTGDGGVSLGSGATDQLLVLVTPP